MLVAHLLGQLAPSPAVQFVLVDGKGGPDYDRLMPRAWLSAKDDLDRVRDVLRQVHRLMVNRQASIASVLGVTDAWHLGPSPYRDPAARQRLRGGRCCTPIGSAAVLLSVHHRNASATTEAASRSHSTVRAEFAGTVLFAPSRAYRRSSRGRTLSPNAAPTATSTMHGKQ
jgi:hypothetical protein